MVAVFDAGPVAANERVPSGWRAAFGGLRADVVACVFVGFSAAETFAVDGDDAARVGVGGLSGVGGVCEDGALFDASVSFFGWAVGGRFVGKGGFDGGVEVVLVAFDLQAVVSAFFVDGLGDVGDGVQAVGSDGFSVECG